MHYKKGIINIVGLGLAVLGFGQSATDHPNLKSGNSRTGVNGNVAASGPGFLKVESFTGGVRVPSSLRWFLPFESSTPVDSLRLNEVNPFQTVIDNSDFGSIVNLDSSGVNVGPFDPQPSGSVTGTAGWNPADELEEALLPYRVVVRRNINPLNPVGFDVRNYNSRHPSHHWTRTTASLGGIGGDPRQAIVPGNLRSFQWTFTPQVSIYNSLTNSFTTVNDTVSRSYGVSVWIPQGPVNVGGTRVFPQRYFAYEITYGIGQTYVDVVDTWATGGGWVRLGNSGRPTNQVFPYNGVNPLRVRLLNTIPRNGTDSLTETVNGALTDDRFAVFADAVKFSTENDSYFATPTSAGFGGLDIRVTGARNEVLVDPTTIPGVGANYKLKPTTIGKGVITSYDHNTGNERWRYSPLEEGPETFTFDNTNVRMTPSAGWSNQVGNPNRRGVDYLRTAVNLVAPTENVNIQPDTDLGFGSYEVYAYVGGDVTFPVEQYATRASYEIFEGGVSEGVFTLNMSGPPGWKRIGKGRYTHADLARLSVRFSNFSPLAADAGKFIYVDQVRFVGAVGNQIKSTPVHARAYIRQTPGVDPVETNVVIVADERGRIHCLDATGNGDGTTTSYWTYPSTRTDATDPNINLGLDPFDPIGKQFDGLLGTRSAQMPVDFDLSTATVQRMQVLDATATLVPRDYLIIGSKNGRVYSIAMEGRGDFNVATKVPGTTYRRWTYPETFPDPSPKASVLGNVSSVVTATIPVGGVPRDVAIVATEQGRIYCLDALSTTSYYGTNDGDTTILWQYPAANAQTFAPITGAPTLDETNGRLFFGTDVDEDTGASNLVCLDTNTGLPIWTNISDVVGAPERLDWKSGSAYVPAATLTSLPGLPPATGMGDTLFAMNENGNVYAINAANGVVLWRTNELQSGGKGSIIYTEMTTYNAAGVLAPFPVIMVPTSGGRFAALFARLGEESRFGNRLAWGYEVDDPIQASMTVSNRWLYGATTNGFLLAWSDLANAGNVLGLDGPTGPGRETISDNEQDALYEEYRNCEVAYLSPAGYRILRRTTPGGISGLIASTAVIGPGGYVKPNGRLIAPYLNTNPDDAFEWGETIYVIAYNFPIRTTNTRGQEVPPPSVNLYISTAGKPEEKFPAEARLFADKTTSDLDAGYAVFAVPFTSGGRTALTPGPGSLRCEIRTSATNSNNAQQTISLNPATAQLSFRLANPIGISVEDTFATDAQSRLGYTVVSSDQDALMNGSQNIAGVLGAQFARSVGQVAHGTSKKTVVNIFDRSLMTLLRGEGRGLDLVRVDRRDLKWQGGAAAVAKPFASLPGGVAALLTTFEDLPTLFPNISLDYPDIRREGVRVRKDPNGNVENPVFNSVGLKGPVGAGGVPVDETNAATRAIVPTVFEFQVDAPKYQPVNLGNTPGSVLNHLGGGSFWNGGYAGRFTVYVDSDQSGTFGGGSREAYRTFNLGAALVPDERIVIGNPNVDLGSLAAGTGYNAGLSYTATRPFRVLDPSTLFSPYALAYDKLYKPIQAFNEGNVNLLNLRLAKGVQELNGTFTGVSGLWPWQLLSQGNNDQVWLDAATDVHSDVDRNFAPPLGATGQNFMIVQKPRVGDTSGRQVRVNPSSRINPNIPLSGLLLNPARPDLNRDPRVAVTLPFGMPVGRYSQVMRFVEDTNGFGFNDENLTLGYVRDTLGNLTGSIRPFESFSDPTFTLTFNVKETQLTGGRSQYTDTVINEGNAPPTAAAPAQWSDVDPTGFRQSNGSLLMAFASNRPTMYPAAGNANPNNRNYNIFVGRVVGGVLGAADATRSQDSDIRDLNKFIPNDPANGRWLAGTGSILASAMVPEFTANLTRGVPAPVAIGGVVDPATVSLTEPSFPNRGDRTLAGGVFARNWMVFVGNAKRNTANGVINDSRLMAAQVSPAGGVSTPIVLDADPTMVKSNPAVVQNGASVGVFYSGKSNGVSSIYYTTINTVTQAFTVPIPLAFGNAFESVGSPSATLRNTFRNGVAGTELDLMFSGRVRGSNINEVFMARYAGDPTLTFATGFVSLGYGMQTLANGQLSESVSYDAKFNGYRARGLQWQGPMQLVNDAGVSVFADAAGNPTFTPVGTVDRQTKLQSYPTIFGGRVLLDPNQGIVKFTQTQLPKNVRLTVRYTPDFMRMSSGSAAGYSASKMLFDSSFAPSNAQTYAFWKAPSGADEPAASTNTFADRIMLAAVRGAVSGGQTSRPVMSTFRLGARVGRVILTNSDGSLGETVTITGNSGSFQLDPSAGRIYFTRFDEDKVVRIRLGGGNGLPPVDITVPVTYVGESTEEFIPMENAVNEANIALFLDNVGMDATVNQQNRRNMVWMLWSSTRNGSPSLYMQTVARKITPLLP